MSLIINNNYGTINHIENSQVHIGEAGERLEVNGEMVNGGDSKKDQATPYTPPIPREGDYNGVRLYIEERKKYDEHFRIAWDSHNLKQNCDLLTRELGWLVDDHSLGTNINRHR